EQETLWAELQGRAERLLEHPKDLEPREPIRRYSAVLRLWHHPAFGPQTSWTVLTPGRKAPPGSLPLAREVTWDREADNRRVFEPGQGPLPSVRIRDAILPEQELRQVLEAGLGHAVPLIVFTGVRVVDGEYFGLETYEVSPFVRVQWWNEGPVAWRHFTDW